MNEQLIYLLIDYRVGYADPSGIAMVTLAPLQADGAVKGYVCVLGFEDGTTRSFSAPTLPQAVDGAKQWASAVYR